MSTFPIYKQSKITGMIVQFVGLNEGTVMETGTSSNPVGYKSNNWYHPYTDEDTWKDCPEEWLIRNNIKSCKDSVESLDLFDSLTLFNGFYKESTITKVPNGYVMTSHSGHQIFIKENTKEII